ncbi:MAG: hypothetical protein O2923_06165 [Verrucomicrobia bacterium]|nr:hypothetical protein [Verrucomicrobiota bacterium]
MPENKVRLYTSGRTSKRAGTALLMAMTMVVAVSLIGFGLITLGQADAVETGKSVSTFHAFWTAEAGLSACKAAVAKEKRPFEDMPLFGTAALVGATDRGSYSIDVIDDPAWMNAGNTIKKYVVSSTGTAPGGVLRRVRSKVTMRAFAGFFGGQGATVAGSSTLQGEVASNNDITVGSSAAVQGDAVPGPGYAVLGSPENVTGTTNSAPAVRVLEPIDPADIVDAQFDNDNASLDPTYYNAATKELVLSGGDSTTIPAGTYYLEGVDVTGSGALSVSGDVTIYLAGEMDIGGGGVINLSSDPDSFQLNVTGSTDVRLHGRADFHGHIYASGGSLIQIGGSSDFHGTVATGGSFELQGSGSIIMDLPTDLTWTTPLFTAWKSVSPSP